LEAWDGKLVSPAANEPNARLPIRQRSAYFTPAVMRKATDGVA
jgi:hypothetical protein